MLSPLIIARGCVINILLHTGGLIMHNRLGQKKNSFLTAYSLPNGMLRAPPTLTHWSLIIIGVLQYNSLKKKIGLFWLRVQRSAVRCYRNEHWESLWIVLLIFFWAALPIAFFALNAGSMLDFFKRFTTSCVWNSVISRMLISVTSSANDRTNSLCLLGQTVCVCSKTSYRKCWSLGRNRRVEYIYVLDRMWGQFYLSLLQTYSALHLLTQYILFLIHVLTFERFSIDLWRSCSFGVLVYALVRNRCRHLQQYSP